MGPVASEIRLTIEIDGKRYGTCFAQSERGYDIESMAQYAGLIAENTVKNHYGQLGLAPEIIDGTVFD